MSRYTKDTIDLRYRNSVGDFTYGHLNINGNGELKVGKFCSIAPDVLILLEGHRLDWVSMYPFLDYDMSTNWSNARLLSNNHIVRKGPVIIGNDVWLGTGATILGNVKIGDGAVVCARSLVVRNIKPYSVYGGIPAKFMYYRFNAEIIEILKKLKWWDWPYEKINKYIHILCEKPNLEVLKKLLEENNK